MIYTISERIRTLREKHGLTQSELAARIGISRSAVNSWEMSLSSPSIANIIEMTKVFSTTADYILLGKTKPSVDLSELTDSQQEIIYKMIDCLKSANNR